MQKLKVGVVGVGHIGREHARIYSQLPDAQFVGVYDIDPVVALTVAQQYDIRAFQSLDDLVEAVDAVSVATPTTTHRDVAQPFLSTGRSILLEKPISDSPEQARELVRMARASGAVLQIGHIERFNPILRVLEERLTHPRFIEAHRLSPYPGRSTDIGVVLDLMIHDLDIVRELAGSPVKRIDAVGSRVLGKHVDIASARLLFEDGCVANVTASRVSFEPLRRTRVFGDETFISMDFASRRAFVVRKAPGFDLGSLDAAAQARWPQKGSFKEFVAQGLLDASEIDMDEANPLLSELSTFIAAVRGEPRRGVSAQDGLAAMELAVAVSQSIDSHRWT